MSEQNEIPRVVLVGLASCFGCQINITNAEKYLMDVLGQIDMQYWQLTSSDPMPDDIDVAVIEGAVTTKEAEEVVKDLRERAGVVITIGACAETAGIPGIAAANYEGRQEDVYRGDVPAIVSDIAFTPKRVSDVIDVDRTVLCCPIDPFDFAATLQSALYGNNIYKRTSTLCGECKRNERGCFYSDGKICMGLVTMSGCGAKCPNLGRPCNGCAGLSPDANIESARRAVQATGADPDIFESGLEIFNMVEVGEPA